MAIGCASGIYLNKRADGHCESLKPPPFLVTNLLPTAYRKVLDFNTPTSIVAIPEFNKFIVHCESELYSYPLELVIGVYQEDATSQPSLQDSEEKLAQGDGDVLFFMAGRVANRTFSKQLKPILTHFLIAYPQNSRLCIEEWQECYLARIRVDRPGTEPPVSRRSEFVIPTFGFGSSPHAL
jgi:hypothetical protein